VHGARGGDEVRAVRAPRDLRRLRADRQDEGQRLPHLPRGHRAHQRLGAALTSAAPTVRCSAGSAAACLPRHGLLGCRAVKQRRQPAALCGGCGAAGSRCGREVLPTFVRPVQLWAVGP